MRLILGTLLTLALVCEQGLAQESPFKRLQLAYGVSIEVPSHWTVLSQSTRSNLGAAGRAIMDNAGLEAQSGRKENLLAVNAVPDPTGAMVRVSVTTPPEYSQADLAAATQSDLKEVASELLAKFRKLESSGGPKIIQMQTVRLDTINNYRVLVMPYTRHGAVGPSPWQVTQYKIPLSDRLIEVTLSYRESDAIVWRPIIERVKRSIKF